jgi:translation initiation factor 2B subunit (eIF-2B alpha/beta/delta family)
MSESENITEQKYLELAEDFKIKYEEMEEKIKHKDEQLLEIKKELISCYGYVRILDNLYSQQDDHEPTIHIMLEVLREFLSQFTEDLIFS